MNDFTFISLVVYFLSSYGVTIIVALSKIFNPLRESLHEVTFLQDLINCTMCFGWWVGLFASFYFFGVLDYGVTNFLLACASSGATWTLASFTENIYYSKMLKEHELDKIDSI